MSVLLRTGECLWASAGHHECDDKGFAIRCEQDTEITFESQDTEDMVLVLIRADRDFRGVDQDTGLPPIIVPTGE